MKETRFIEQNREKWASYEQMLQSRDSDPAKLNDLFVQIMDDLSYARTFYPNRSVKVYLNHLAQRIFHDIYKGRRFPKEKLVRFWTDQLPQVIWESRRAMQLSLLLFILSFAIGVLSSIINPEFARVILGNEYVDMTLANIEKGDPMAVYKDPGAAGMAAGIAANNLFVALKTAIMGVLASVGTAFMMIYNGIMVGAFQYFFIDKGLFWPSFLTIWIHGTLEISAIIIAGGAGLTAGAGLLFPGTYSRTQAFQITMRRGLKIFIGIVPVIILAAFFEGFLTRFTETPDVLRGLFILLSLAFVLGYFVWLPWNKARLGAFPAEDKDADLPPDVLTAIEVHTVKTAGGIISDAFTIFKRHIGWSLGLVTAAAAGFTLLVHTFFRSSFDTLPTFSGVFEGLPQYWGTSIADPVRWIFVAVLWGVAMMSVRIAEREISLPEQVEVHPSGWWLMLIPAFLAALVWSAEKSFWWWAGGILVIPGLTQWIAGMRYAPFSETLTGAHRLIRGGNTIFTGFLITTLLLLSFFFINSELWMIFLRFFSWLAPPGENAVQQFSQLSTMFAVCWMLFFCWQLWVWSGILLFFSHKEQTEAHYLKSQIERVGTSRQIRGIPKE